MYMELDADAAKVDWTIRHTLIPSDTITVFPWKTMFKYCYTIQQEQTFKWRFPSKLQFTVMKTLHEFASTLKASQKAQRVTAVELADRLGLSAQAVRQMLAGTTAPRLTNAMALADELGLELVLVPKEIAQSLSQPAKVERATKSDVERLLSGEPL